MKRVFRAGAAAACVLGAGSVAAIAQSSDSASSKRPGISSWFSGMFGGAKGNEGSPVDLDFRISGDRDSLLGELRTTSLLVSAQDEGRVTGQDMLAAARGDYARLLGVLYDHGYYSVIINITLDGVEAASIAPLDAPKVVHKVLVNIDPGPRFHYSRAEIAPLAPRTELPQDYHPGGIARTGDMKRAATTAVEAWRNVGHAKADVTSTDITADHRANVIDSRIALAPGPVLRFGQLTIRGEKRMDPRRLRKISGFPEGEVFDPEKLEDVRKRLRRSGVFSAITLTEADYIGPGNTLDVDLQVVEQKLRRLGAGFEYSNTDGLSLTGYWINRNLLRVDAGVSDIGGDTGRDYNLGVRIDRPATLNADTTGYVLAQAVSEQEDDYRLKSATIGLGFTYLPNDHLTADVGLQYRALRVDDDSGRTNFRLIALPGSLTLDMRDNQTDAKSGYWLSTNVTPFVGLQDETGSGAQLIAEGRKYYSFGTDDKYTLAGRARLGTVVGPELAETPRDYLFWSGGGGTVRGHSFESLGVEEIQGPDGPIKTGGMSIVTLTAEMRMQVRDKIGLAVFSDAGRVWADSAFSGDSGWQAGAGAGIRYKTPIGPMRFDLAAPVGGGDREDKGVQVYIGLGQAF
jgi:translocation and assembly module TamA